MDEDIDVTVRVSVEGEDPGKLAEKVKKLNEENAKAGRTPSTAARDANVEVAASKKREEQNRREAKSAEELADANAKAAQASASGAGEARGAARNPATGRFEARKQPTVAPHVTPDSAPVQGRPLSARERLIAVMEEQEQAAEKAAAKPSVLHHGETGRGRVVPMPPVAAPLPALSPDSPTTSERSPFHSAVLAEARAKDEASAQQQNRPSIGPESFLGPDSPTLTPGPPPPSSTIPYANASDETKARNQKRKEKYDEHQADLSAAQRERTATVLDDFTGDDEGITAQDAIRALERQVINEMGRFTPGGKNSPTDDDLRKTVRSRIAEMQDTYGEDRTSSLFDAADEYFDPERRAQLNMPGGFRGTLRGWGERVTAAASRSRPLTAAGALRQGAMQTVGGALTSAGGGAAAGGGLAAVGAGLGPLAAIAGAAMLTKAVIDLGKAFVRVASEASQARRETQRIFGNEGQHDVYAAGAQSGLTRRESAGMYGDLSIGLRGGLSESRANEYAMQAGAATGTLIANYRGKESIGAVTSFMQGDYEGMQRLGLDVDQGDISMRAMELGFTSVTSEATKAALALGVLEEAALAAADEDGDTGSPRAQGARDVATRGIEAAGEAAKGAWDWVWERNADVIEWAANTAAKAGGAEDPNISLDPAVRAERRNEREGYYVDASGRARTTIDDENKNTGTAGEGWTPVTYDEYQEAKRAEEDRLALQRENAAWRGERAVERVDPTNRIAELERLMKEAEAAGESDRVERLGSQIEQAKGEQYNNAWQLYTGQVNIARGAERGTQDIARQEALAIEDIWRQHGRQLEDIERQNNRAREDIHRNYARSIEDLNIGLARQLEDLDRQFARSMEDRAWALDKWSSATERVYSKFGHSSERVIQNLEDQNRRFKEWSENLAALRERGLSEDAIRILEADDPVNESQVRQLASSSDEQIQAINRQIAERVRMAEEAAPGVDVLGVGRQRERGEEDIRRGQTRAIEDLNRNLSRSYADLSLSAVRSSEDMNIGVQRQMEDLTIGTERQLEQLNISVSRQMADLVHSITGAYADSKDGALGIFDSFMNELEGKANLNAIDIGQAIKNGFESGLTGEGIELDTVLNPKKNRVRRTGDLAQGLTRNTLQMYASGGIATSPHMGVFGEAGNEAMVPLNSHGVKFLAQAIRASQGVFDKELTRGVRDPVPAMRGGDGASTQAMMSQMLDLMAMQMTVTDTGTNYNGPITVKADDPARFERELRQRQAFRKLTKTRGAA